MARNCIGIKRHKVPSLSTITDRRKCLKILIFEKYNFVDYIAQNKNAAIEYEFKCASLRFVSFVALNISI